MKTIIGVIPAFNDKEKTYTLAAANIDVFAKHEVIAFIIPYEQHINTIVSLVDGLYVTGGDDIDPTLFGEEPHPKLRIICRQRDLFERELIRAMYQQNKPILGVCRGAQIMNIALGGTMYQDLHSQQQHALLQHEQHAMTNHASHFVHVVKGSLLHRLVQGEKIKVNSYHHQANRKLGKTLTVSGVASDGVIEAIECAEQSFMLGVQWHPELLAVSGDVVATNIYDGFIQACIQGREKRASN